MKSCLVWIGLVVLVAIGTCTAQIGTFSAPGKQTVERTMMQPLPEVYEALDAYLTGATHESGDYGVYGDGPVTAQMTRKPQSELRLTLRTPDLVLMEVDAKLKAGSDPNDTDIDIDYDASKLAYKMKVGIETAWLQQLVRRDIEAALTNIQNDRIIPETLRIKPLLDHAIKGRHGDGR